MKFAFDSTYETDLQRFERERKERTQYLKEIYEQTGLPADRRRYEQSRQQAKRGINLMK